MLSPEQLVASSIPHPLLDQAGELHLTMHLGRRSISAAIHDAHENVVKWVHQELFANESDSIDFIKHRNWKDQTFRKVSISFDSDACTLVPSGFYEASRADELLSVLFRNHPSNHTRATDISLFSAKLLYRIPEEIMELTQWFQHASVFPSMHAFLSRHFEVGKTGISIALQRLNDYLILRIQDGKKLVFCNFFRVHHDEDVLYYLANACMNLNINMNTALIIAEGVPEGSSLWETLSKYCLPAPSKVLFETPSQGAQTSADLNGLYQNFLCAL